MKKVAVEKDLSNVAEYLRKEGYSIQPLSNNSENNKNLVGKVDALVVSNLFTDVMGIEDADIATPIVYADGLTPQEVKNQIDQKAMK